jgi:hypothetical protein
MGRHIVKHFIILFLVIVCGGATFVSFSAAAHAAVGANWANQLCGAASPLCNSPLTLGLATGTAAVGTALGAVAGAAIGSVSGNMGTGAALGAGTGLVAGSAIGAGNGDAAGGSLQVRYDTVYAQCMTAKGNRIGGPPVAEPVYVYPPPYYWGPRYYFSYGW